MTPTKLLVCTPSIDGKYCDNYLDGILRLQLACIERGIEMRVRRLCGHSLIPVGRTILIRDFMDTDFTHLLFWDSDIGAELSVIFDLLDADKPLIGAVCVQKRYDWENILKASRTMMVEDAPDLPKAGGIFTFSTTETGNDVDILTKNPIPIKYVGMGLTLIKRSLIETMARCFATATVKLPNGRPFPALTAQRIVDQSNPEGGTWLSEDYAFCSRANESSKEHATWLAWWTKTSHTGQHKFEGDLVTAGSLLGGDMVQANE